VFCAVLLRYLGHSAIGLTKQRTTMDVIKKGRNIKDPCAKFTCYACGAVVKAAASEGESVHVPDGESFVRMKCPCCRLKNSVPFTAFVL